VGKVQLSIEDGSPLEGTGVEAPSGLPLSYGQRALWFLDRLSPGNPAYVIAGAALARGGSRLCGDALLRAARTLVARHPALRATFHEGPDGPRQRIHAEARLDFHAIDAVEVDDAGELEVSRRLSVLAFLPFDLERGPLLRLGLFQLAGGEQALVLAVHHIVADFWSVGVLLRELGVLYGREVTPGTLCLSLPEPAFDYAAVAAREAERLAGPAGERLWDFWRQALAGYPLVLELPTDHPRPLVQTYRGAARDVRLEPAAVAALRRLTRLRGATLYMGLLAAFEALLSRHSGQERLVVGCPTTGRADSALAGLVGYLVNPVAIPGDISGDPTFGELLGRTREAALAAFAYQEFPFPLLAERLQADRDPSRSPVFQAVLVLQKGRRAGEEGMAALSAGASGARLAFGPLGLESLPLDEPGAQFDLSAVLAESPEGLAGRFLYNRDLFEAATAERLAGHFMHLLTEVAADPARWLDVRVSALPLVSAAERHQLTVGWNDTAAAPGGMDEPVHELVVEQARRRPNAIAATWRNAALSYGELLARSGRLAGRLRRLGVGPEVPVAICLGASLSRVVAPLAVLRAGGGYVPLDPTYPAERLAFILADSGAPVVLTERAFAAALPPLTAAEIVDLEEDGGAGEEIPTPPAVGRESLAYGIYTSGSTGEPKAIAIPHGGLANLARWHGDVFEVMEADRGTLVASPGFDAAVDELWPYLTRGASVHLVDEETRLSAAAILRFWMERGITLSFLPTPLAEAVLLEEIPAGEIPLRFLLTGGDRLHFGPAPGSPFRLMNLYGPSEYSVITTRTAVVPAGNAGISIGRPIANTRLLVLGPRGELAPIGVPGELWITGAGLARGYAGRPELTAERFVPVPVAITAITEPGARAYRTGDLVRLLPDGQLDFLGRTDLQVKIRGFRIELGEIEAALGAHPRVAQAAVLVREESPGGRRLVAGVVARPGSDLDGLSSLDPGELRAFLGRRLPEYMVPAIAVLAVLPLSPNGKVDRKALAALPAMVVLGAGTAGGAGEDNGEAAAPSGPLETAVAAVWAEVLGRPVESLGAGDNFFEIGGHSLLATQVVSRLRSALGVELPVRTVFEAPTIASLAARLASLRGNAGETGTAEGAGEAISRRSGLAASEFPLSFAQERLWFVDQLEPGSAAYNLPGALRLRGALDVSAFAAAVGEVARRHEALRTVFSRSTSGTPVQVVRPASPASLPIVDLGDLPTVGRREVEAERVMAFEARRPFDLAAGPLLRLTLLRLGAAEHLALVSLHHIVADGWSLGVFTAELTALYAAFVANVAGAAGAGSPLPELPIQYGDFAVWQRRRLAGSALAGLLAWWRERLAGAPAALDLPTDRPRPLAQSFRGGHQPLRLPPSLAAAVRALGKRSGTTLFMTLLAAFQALLARSTGQDDVPVGSPIAGRTEREIEGLIGFFVNTLVLRGDLSGRPTFAALLGRVRETTLGAFGHQDLPFEKLVEELRPERHLDHAPLFQVLFVVQNAPPGVLRLPGVEVEPVMAESGIAKFDLTFTFREEPDGALVGIIEYSRDLFDRTTAIRLGERFAILLEAAVADPSRPLAELPLSAAPELHQMQVEWNDSPAGLAAPEKPELVPALLAARAVRHPDALALTLDGEWMSYGELAVRTGRIAGHLRALGVAPESRVGIAVERSFAMVAALLAIWEAGGAYLPIDPTLPAERQAFLLADAGVSVLLTQADRAEALAEFSGCRVNVLDLWESAPARGSIPAARPALLPDHPAYVLYTSGSTGRPKGVVVTHGALGGRLRFARERELWEGDRFVHKTTISFDASILEVFGPLLVGGTTVLARPGGERDPGYLVGLLRDGEIPLATFTMAMLAALVRDHSLVDCGNLRTVFSGGEAMPVDLPARFYAQSGADLYNRYGPTEATISVTSWRCRPGDYGRAQPIGRPIARTRIHLLDRDLQPVPLGVTGELTIAGPCLARGYLDRPGLTAEKFIPHPGAGPEDGPGARLYRSGDLARFRADGAIEFVGRIDGQVKIRGFRVELGEVESALKAHAAVAAAAVVDRAEPGTGSRRLLAYLVLAPGASLGAAEIKDFLEERLPGYMVPAAFTVLPALPLSPTGKLDRKALPDPAAVVPEMLEAREAPRGPVEELLAGIWAELLGIPPPGREDSFFDLGGHSLLATQVVARVREALQIEVPLRRLFEAPTLAGFAAAVEEAGREGDRPTAPPLAALPREGAPPLSFAQERLWFLDQLEPGSPAYNLPAAFDLLGTLDRKAFASSLAAIVNRHETLRTTFSWTEGQPVPVIVPESPCSSVPVPQVDLTDLPHNAQAPELSRLTRDEARRPFDLTRGPLLRVVLLALGGERHRALFNMHHIVSDGWSVGVLVEELGALYRAHVDGNPAPAGVLPVLPIQYADFAAWQRRWLSGAVLAGEIAWWRETLAGLPPLDLPTDHPRPRERTGRGAVRPVRLSPARAEALARLSRAAGGTLFMTLLAGFSALLARITGQDDLAVGSPIANRTHRESEGLIGFFVNTLVLRSDLRGDPEFRQLLERARRTTLAAYAHQDLPFEKVVEAVSPERDPGRTPVFQVLFALQNAPRRSLDLPGLELRRVEIPDESAKFDLTLNLAATDEGLAGIWEYSTDLFEAATVARLTDCLGELLAGAAAAPEARLWDLPLLTAVERRQLEEWRGETTTYPRESTVHELFREQARHAPDAVALVAAETVLSYGALDRGVERLASSLAALGVGVTPPETPVGVCLTSPLDRVVVMLAILTAGGAFVPLDAALPRERLAFLLADTAAPIVVTDESRRDLLPEPPQIAATVLCLDRAEDWIAVSPRPGKAHPESLAYIMYTSGSTGTPKGVAVTHRGIVRLVRGTDCAPLGSADRVAQLANTAFDATTWEIWGALLNGSALVLVERDVALSPRRLAAHLAEQQVTALFLTTALLNQVAGEEPAAFHPLAWVLFGGEAADPERVRRVLRAGGPGRLIHVYGPTENTTFSTWHPVSRLPAGATTVAIGTALANSTIEILDRGGRPAPAGIPGELVVGGDGLARGYVGRPELTAERFVPSPSGPPGSRLYRTGDLVRFNPDGGLDFLGRIDGQVKIRGFRIEPGEIEVALATHPGVGQAAVVVREEGGEKRLFAYVSSRPGSEPPAIPELRAHLRERLPEYMVPAGFLVLSELPLNSNGKVDRRALPVFEIAAAARPVSLPRTPAEEVMAGIWAEVLGIDAARIDLRDSFFELGGHSLLATRLISRVREAFGVELPVKAVFDAPTVAGLAARAEEELARGLGLAAPPLVPLPLESRRDLPLSFAQERLWFLDQLEPGSSSYNVPFALQLAGMADVGRLAASLGAVVRRHEALRTTFSSSGQAATEGPVQVIAPERGLDLPLVDLAALPDPLREATALSLARAEAARPFDLGRGPLLCALLFRARRDRHLLLLNLHHIVSDGWSMGVLVRELGEIYGALAAGRPPALPPLPIQYADFAVWQRRWLRGEVLARQLAWWRERLAGAPEVIELPADHPRPAVASLRGASLAVELGLGAAVGELGRERGATTFMVLLAAFEALLSRLSGQERVVVGSPVANRTHAEVEGLIGFFVNTLVLPANLAADPTFASLLGQLRETTLGAYAHQDLPFEKLVEALAPERSLAYSPLFQVMLTFQNAPLPTLSLPGLTAEPAALGGKTEKFDLSLTLMTQGENTLVGSLSYSVDLFERTTAERLVGWFSVLLAGALGEPERRVSELPLLAAAEREQLQAWSAGADLLPEISCLHELVAAQAARTPAAEALVAGDERLTYAELAARAGRLAAVLRGLGVGPEERVGVCLERGPALVVALLAVLEAGGAYVPLDPTYPEERLGLMLGDSGARVLLTQENLIDRLPAPAARVVLLDAAGGTLNRWETRPAGPAPETDNLAYLIYTSGSTGIPKGVALTHRSAVAMVRWAQATWSREELAGVLFATSVCFDLSVFELFVPLASGGRVIVAANALALPTLPAAGEVTLVNTVPSAMAELVRQSAVPASVRTVNLAGEALQRPLVAVLYGLPQIERVWNLYGPSEDTTYSTFALQSRSAERSPGIGHPIAGTRAHVFDRGQRPSPLGVPGELFLGGAGLARGYFGRPELTAERFVPDPQGDGERLYRTGDLVRYPAGAADAADVADVADAADAELEFLGRIDHQVKVRGFRIELGEIEAALAAQPEVAEVAVLVREDRPGDPRLVAYLAAGGAAEPSPVPLRAALRARLPEYMVPGAFVVLPRLPLSPNGKVDRRALSRIAPALEVGESAAAASRTPAEELMAGIWADVLGREKVDLHGNFFDLGGHSLLATRLLSRVRAAFGVELPLKVVFEAPTVAGLAGLAERALAAGLGTTAPPLLPLPPASRGAGLPLSFAQERLWFLDQLETGSAAYNLPVALKLSGALDVSALEASLAAIVRRHEALRTIFRTGAEGPEQVIARETPLALPVVDLGALPAPVGEYAARRLVMAEAARPFDLARGPLLRALLLRERPEHHLLIVPLHHIVSDGWSLGVLVRELGEGYAARVAGRAMRLPDLPVQYADYAVWQRGWLAGEELSRQLAWWRERLAGAPEVIELPADRPRLPVQSFRGASLPVALPPSLGATVSGLGRSRGATVFMVLLAAFQALLSRLSGQARVVVGSPVANRTHREVEGLIGFFVNTLPLPADLATDPTVTALLAQVRETTLGAYAHQDVPFEKLVLELAPERSLAHSPLFQVMLILQNAPLPKLDLPGLTAEPLGLGSGMEKFDLTLTLSEESAGGLVGALSYSVDRFERTTAERLRGWFSTLLAGAVAAPERTVSELPLLAAAERAQLQAWGTGAALEPDLSCLHELVAAQAARTPSAEALLAGSERLTYAEIQARASGLAAVLRGLGVGPEERVGVCLERSPALVVALLAVLGAGGAYVPLDPAYPTERLRLMLGDSGARVLLTQPELSARLDAPGVRTVRLDRAGHPLATWLRISDGPASGPDNLAYLIYTSGSTGTPKGVALSHRSAVSMVRWAREVWSAAELSGVLFATSVSFDLSVFELFVPLATGGRVILADHALALATLPAAGEVTLVNTVPSAMAELVRDGGLPASVRTVNLAGEALPRPLVAALYALPQVERVWNLYGPSEDTTYSTFALQERSAATSPAIGQPLAGTRAYVFDRWLRPSGLGVPGELFLGGAGLARGYFGRPELTAERFVPDPSGRPGERLYRTGDLVRFRADGELEFLGRIDHQVKVRGFRIELGEIEAALATQPDVEAAVVLARESGSVEAPGDLRLVAYVVPKESLPDLADRLRAALTACLPGYMVPAVFVLLAELPLSPNGKVDRKALPAPEWSGGPSYVAPRTALEEILARIWREVLGVERVGIEDSFFRLGGHSLLATRLVSRVRQTFQVDLPLRRLFETPTVAALAELVTAAETRPGQSEKIARVLLRLQERAGQAGPAAEEAPPPATSTQSPRSSEA
jgi:amino acid adenylation domain-containing protein